MNSKEDFLDFYSKNYNPDESMQDFDAVFKKFHVEKIIENLSGNNILELGCAAGYSTKLLDEFGHKVTVVEGSINYINLAKEKYEFNNVEFIHSLWEELELKVFFSDILLVDSLQLVKDRKKLILKIKNLMEDKGRLHLIVPNKNSFHRILGKEMKIIDTLESGSERDIEVRAKQDLNWDSVRNLVIECGLKTVEEYGILFKIFDNKKMLQLDENTINALFSLGNQFKENAAHMYLCCEKID